MWDQLTSNVVERRLFPHFYTSQRLLGWGLLNPTSVLLPVLF